MSRKFAGVKSQRKNLNMRCTDQLRAMVEAAAVASGRCLSDEVLWRVERSFREDDLRAILREEARAALNEALDRREPANGEPLGSPPPAYAQ